MCKWQGTVQYRQIAEEQDVWCTIDVKRDQLGHDFSNGKLIMVSSPKKSIIGDFTKQWCKKLYMPIWNEFEVEDYIKSAIKQALASVGPGMLCNQAKDFSGDEFTHKLIHMRINLKETEVEGEKADQYTCCSCFFESDYIAYKCLKRLEENKEDLRTFIETAMGSLCGQLFELVSHEILRTFPVRVNSQVTAH
ncbi:hypothetical protein RhiirA5_444003 [Rhizophagus irregularis]|uniref:Crinkler family protein n=1 Tax=Rhizophagus irregularis TaxID=588596 RepID=A0A2N0NDM1_9GLOM|nr:hypothetical protein RhiirA5_444003 [Rhizophagus irregularis]